MCLPTWILFKGSGNIFGLFDSNPKWCKYLLMAIEVNRLFSVGGEIFALARVDAENGPDAGGRAPRSNHIVRQRTTTDENGYFRFDVLPAKSKILIGMDTAPNIFRSLATVYLEPGETRLDQVFPTQKRFTTGNIEDRFAKFLRNNKLIHTHGLVVIFTENDATRVLRNRLLTYEESPDVGWYLPISVMLNEELPDKNRVDFLSRQSWEIPKDGEILLVTLNGGGSEIGQQIVRADNLSDAADFLSKHRIAKQNARQKLNDALAEATNSGRTVWARVSQTRCGPCIRMSDWIERNRELLEKAFVLVDIDNIRDEHGQETAEKIGYQVSIPWHAMLDAQGEILITSESEIGNIGSPDPSFESLRHMRKMLERGAGNNLTSEEIDALLETIK